MSHKANDQLIDDITDAQNVSIKNYDNLFSANHRRAMLERYGYSEAQKIIIKDE